MTDSAHRPRPRPRTLAVFCASPSPSRGDGTPPAAAATAPPSAYERADDPDPAAAMRLLGGGGGAGDLVVLEAPTLAELRDAAERLRPTHVYVVGAFASASAANPVLGRLGPLAFRRGEGDEEEGSAAAAAAATVGGNGDAEEDEGVCAAVAEALAAAGPQLACAYLDVSPGAAAPGGGGSGAALAVAEELRRRRRWGRAADGREGKEEDDGTTTTPSSSVALVGWPGDAPAALASHFARAFFQHLSPAHDALSTPAEAYGVALLAAGAVAARGGGGESGAGGGDDDEAVAEEEDAGAKAAPCSPTAAAIVLPRAPDLLLVSSDGVSDAGESTLPDAHFVPRPHPGELPPGVTGPAAVPGWAHAALLAPRCEVRVRVAAAAAAAAAPSDGGALARGSGDLAARLTCLGEGLRALLAAEVRALELVLPPAAAAAAAPAPNPLLLLEPLDPSPCPLPSACRAVRAHVRTRSRAVIPVVAVLPDVVIDAANGSGKEGSANSGKPALARLALRHALLSDALALQLLLPPLGAPMPRARARPDVAGGLPGADCLARTSAWAATLLRCLALGREDEAAAAATLAGGRALAALGVTAVGCAPTRALSAADVERLYALVVPSAALEREGVVEEEEEEEGAGAAAAGVSTQLRLARPTAQEILILAGAAASNNNNKKRVRRAAAAPPPPRGGGPVSSSIIPRADPPTPNPAADDSRPLAPAAAAHAAPGGGGGGGGGCLRQGQRAAAALADCPDAALSADLAAFFSAATGGGGASLLLPQPRIGPAVNVSLPALYRAVASRGGFRAASAINWRGRVLPACCSASGSGSSGAAASLRLAAAGHALRRLYAAFLWDYERAHPADVSGGERCPLCGRGDDDDAGLHRALDWLACDGCDAWVHYSCDGRGRGGGGGLAPFEAYENEGWQYFCERCGGNDAGGGAVAAPPAAT